MSPSSSLSSVPAATTPLYPGAADLAPGLLIATDFGSTGGVTIELSTKVQPDGSTLEKKVKRFDHATLQRRAQAVINKGYVILRKFTTPLSFSSLYFVPEADFEKLDSALEECRTDADLLNEEAAERGSDRRTTIEIYPLTLNRSSPRIALRIGRAIYEYLVRFRESWESDNTNDYVMEMRLVKNLDKLVIGEQARILAEVLRSAVEQRPIMLARNSEKISDLKRLSVDYSAIDRAIALFAPAAEAI